MDKNVENFFSEVKRVFMFLETDYGFTVIKAELKDEQFYPDAMGVVRYFNKKIFIEIMWHFASAVITVSFRKPKNENMECDPIDCTTINIYALVGYLNGGSQGTFLLQDLYKATFSKIKKREQIIQYNMRGVIENLAKNVKEFATGILLGNTSLFSEVEKYQVNLIEKLYQFKNDELL